MAAVLASFILLALTAALPVDSVSFDLGHLLHACASVLRHRYVPHASGWISAASLLAALATAVLLLRAVVLRAVAVVRGRARQRQLLDLLGRDLDQHGAHVLEHDAPLAYCIPGGRGRIVLTTAARARLGPAQVAAVVAHERAHLRGRHDVVLFGADVALTAFPWFHFFRVAREQTAELVEMLADDRAAREAGPGPLASALVGLGTQSPPAASLGASSQMTASRVLRLVDGCHRASLLEQARLMAVSAVVVALPWAIAAVPVWAARAGYCPLPTG
ncbi:MAG: M56 family metallopeptidase [Actinobacteria bacterium]|nr:M56 family metallopeptidase [Actinomycetota bacterium]